MCVHLYNINDTLIKWLSIPGADWATWHLPCGLVGPPAKYAATSNVEVGQMKTTWTVTSFSTHGAEQWARNVYFR